MAVGGFGGRGNQDGQRKGHRDAAIDDGPGAAIAASCGRRCRDAAWWTKGDEPPVHQILLHGCTQH